MKREEGSGLVVVRTLDTSRVPCPQTSRAGTLESQLVAAEGLPGDEGRGGVSRGSCTWVCNLEL